MSESSLKMYDVRPLPNSRQTRAFTVDEAGLEFVREYYENYEHSDGRVTDEWKQYEVERITEGCFDLGGMFMVSDPWVKIPCNGFILEAMHRHLERLIKSLRKQLRDDGIRILMAYRTYVLSKETALAFADAVEAWFNENSGDVLEAEIRFECATDEAERESRYFRKYRTPVPRELPEKGASDV